jgi:hypothetical protein
MIPEQEAGFLSVGIEGSSTMATLMVFMQNEILH